MCVPSHLTATHGDNYQLSLLLNVGLDDISSSLADGSTQKCGVGVPGVLCRARWAASLPLLADQPRGRAARGPSYSPRAVWGSRGPSAHFLHVQIASPKCGRGTAVQRLDPLLKLNLKIQFFLFTTQYGF